MPSLSVPPFLGVSSAKAGRMPKAEAESGGAGHQFATVEDQS